MKLRSIFFTCSILATLLQGFPTQAQDNLTRTLLITGSVYSNDLEGFFDAIVSKAAGNEIRILLVVADSSDPAKMSEVERSEKLSTAEDQRTRLETDCQSYVSRGSRCTVTLIPVFGLSNTYNEEVIEALESRPTAILISGNERTTTIKAIAGTPIESALSDAYQDGVIIGGAGEIAGIQSTWMIAGYNDDFEAPRSLEFGAVDVWEVSPDRGLIFGLQNAIIDAQFYEQNRFGRLLNAITLADAAHLGIGIDQGTGARILDEDRLVNVFGQNTITILDAETYHSAEAVQYHGSENLLSIRNILVHILSPGEIEYGLKERIHSLTSAPDRIERRFDAIALPARAGQVIVTSNLYKKEFNDPILTHFVNLCGGMKANLLVVAMGYSEDEFARKTSESLIDVLNVPGKVFIASPTTRKILEVSKDTTGIILIGNGQIELQPGSIAAIRKAWLSGIPLFADGSTSAIVGKFYINSSVSPDDNEGMESKTLSYFHLGDAVISPGLGILNLNIEPQLMENNRWGQFFSLAYNSPNLLTLGLAEGAALEFSSGGAVVQGDNVILALDLREALLDEGINRGFIIANGLLDVFTPGERIDPENADIDYAPIRMSTPSVSTATPVLPVFTQTPSPYPTPYPVTPTKAEKQNGLFKNIPTKTPHPATIPPNIPPADPNLARLIIGAGIIIVIVVILGVWINRQRLR